MDISYKGANCVVIKTKKDTVVIDPTVNVKAREVADKNAVILATQEDFLPEGEAAFVVNMPGEYEIRDVSVRGVATKRHIDPEGKAATMYRVEVGGVRFAIIGHVDAPISDEDLETIGVVDVVIVPVGGGGYTLDSRDATTIVRQISPKVVIPTHFADKSVAYEVPQEGIEPFIKEMGGLHETVHSLKLKNGLLPDSLTVFEIARS